MENSLANKKPWLVAEWSERNGSISPDDVPYAEELRRSLFYYYCSKCEWEVVIGPWCGDRGTKEIKVDVYMQVMNNWDIFVDYVWNEGKKQRR